MSGYAPPLLMTDRGEDMEITKELLRNKVEKFVKQRSKIWQCQSKQTNVRYST